MPTQPARKRRALPTAPKRRAKAESPPVKKIEIPRPRWKEVTFTIKGVAPLLLHHFSKEAELKFIESQGEKLMTGKLPPRDPEAEYQQGRCILPDGRDAIRSICIKKAMVGAIRNIDGLTMTATNQVFHVQGDLLPIDGKPRMDTRMVRQQRTNNLRYRPIYDKWKITLTIRYDADAIDAVQLGHLLIRAGEGGGLGEYRAGKGGNLGRFTLA